jgi:quinolinate synthase
VVTYVNTYADVKAETDVCCTSGNAAQVVRSLQAPVVIFLPDEYLASNVAEEAGFRIVFPDDNGKVTLPEKTNGAPIMVGWRGRCEVHEQFTVDDIVQIRKQFPGVEVLTHPECSPEVVKASDYSASTSKMTEYVQRSKAPHFLILTECSMGDNIIAGNPGKDIVRLCNIRCPHMNQITLEDTLNALINNETLIEVPEDIRVRAEKAVRRMIEVRP